MVEIRVPTLGESVTEATIGQWLKKEGDNVAADEPVVELETDKVSVEVPAPAAGVLSKISAQEGDTVELNALLGEIGEGAGAPASSVNGSSAPATNGTAPAAAASASGEEIQIVAPASGESVTEADIGEWMVKVGDQVKLDDPIVSLETDKAAVDVPAPASGTIKEIVAQEGDTVSVGAVLAVMVTGDAPAASAAPAAAPAPSAPKADNAPLSPAPRRVIAENNLDAGAIQGTGKGGRVTKGDALAAIGSVSAAPQPAQAKAPHTPKPLGDREERVKMSRLRQTIASRLKESQNTAAQLTTFNDVDMSAVMSTRSEYKELFEKKHGTKLGFMGFFVKASIAALREVPEVNAEIDGTDVVYKNFVHMGVAVGTPTGLVVPVVRDADQMSFAAIEKKIGELGLRARDGKLSMAEMQGGTF
ncbi:MAG: 2-oxo acid dehydrogenase subunit E2, partial [Pseudomonadota bacterium]